MKKIFSLKFYRDAQEIMRTFLQTQEQIGNLEVDDPQVSYMISAWARICKIMGKDFQPYLPVVMPAVMKTASIKPEVAVLDSKLTSKPSILLAMQSIA